MNSTLPHSDFCVLDVMDVHAGGDMGRVVLGGLADLPGRTVADRARFLREKADGLRRMLIKDPLGDPSLCINLVVPGTAKDADAGVVVMGTMGYPDFSGSNAMCTVAALIETRRLMPPEGDRGILLQTPGGIAEMWVTQTPALTIEYEALPAFVVSTGEVVDVPGFGPVRYELVYGGALYAIVAAEEVALEPGRTLSSEIADFFAKFLPRAARRRAQHSPSGAKQSLSLGLLAGSTRQHEKWSRVPVAVYMHPDVICQGPTGTGTSALLAWRYHRGEIATGSRIHTVSPSGNSFSGTLIGPTRVGECSAVRTRISGKPHIIDRKSLRIERALIERHGVARLFDQCTGASTE